jgi:hypothetical protein
MLCAESMGVMGQLLITLIVPPMVGLITYIVLRRLWEREEEAPSPSEAASRQEPSLVNKHEEMPAH